MFWLCCLGTKTAGIVEKNEEVADEQKMDKFDFRKHDDFKALCNVRILWVAG